MADTLRIKRRVSGSPGAPTSLANAELAYNEVDHILYYGEGTGGAGGTATVTPGIAGMGMSATATPTMNGAGAAGTATNWSRGDHVHPSDTSRAPLASPVFTGDPRAPTPTPGDNDTSIATTAFVAAAITAGGTYLPLSGGTLTGSLTIPAGTVGAPSLNFTGATDTGLSYATSQITLSVGGIQKLQLATTFLSLASSVQFRADFGTQGGPGISFSGDGTSGFFRKGASSISISCGNNEVMNWSSASLVTTAYGPIFLPSDPTAPLHAATKAYVDGLIQGVDAKVSVRAASTANIASLNAPQTIDGVALIAQDRVLVKDQTTQSANGIYIVQAAAWTRALDADTWAELPSAFVFVENGTVNADSGWLCTADPGGTLGTTSVTWVQFSGAGQITAGAGLTKTGNQLDVVGTAARILVNADSIDIDSAYAGQASIVTLGTVATGTWNASTIAVNRGGSGAATLTGYLKGNGTSPFTGNATIPNTDITGLGTMAIQNANAVAITGGTIDGVTLDGGTF